ncbi:hypothetical protein CYPRO_0644 [Cyclonatronum proteinivorum]|uniref:Phosphoribosyl-AMP cyclohydrolase n=1 Tax=Cyclonatronum proteinivorum TaxID=1457365 RepID=A0A345UHH7_9BACT|nr:hypothetical protein [Cyclonatronum proteinivorum]AXI99928.1 hypothetical protein CYPRO_0644 [Cyclonatronum proteinivorum]
MITKEEVNTAQLNWGNAIVEIGKLKDKPVQELKDKTSAMIRELYHFEGGPIMFKPTRAKDNPFRGDFDAALSYFIGHNENFAEDDGFALQPWTAVRFENFHVQLESKRAIAMGEYFFTTEDGEEKKVEYTFGYVKVPSGALKIDLHHSSVPFAPTLGK